MKFATIDIGSNAARLLISDVFPESEQVDIRKLSLIRVPLRLGFDVFSYQRISGPKAHDLRQAMRGYAHLIEAFHVTDTKACATAALRTATNGVALVEQIRMESGLALEIIDGQQEARIIYAAHLAQHAPSRRKFLYIDVGGGSTELTLFANNNFLESESFEVGTIRILENSVEQDEWIRMAGWLKRIAAPHKGLEAIGTGGNINKLSKMASAKAGEAIGADFIRRQRELIGEMNLHDRIHRLGLRSDRADVIVPACDIFLFILHHVRLKRITVPRIGLVDGLSYLLYEKRVRGRPTPID
jgi:exopolyphosphatase/guanosine-5'-triphosphate,3'-diphosphate pyrophosphatase